MKNGTVLLKKEAYTRKKGVDAYVEFFVVGETTKAWLITRYPSRGLEKAFKVPKKADIKDYGFFRSWEEVKTFLNGNAEIISNAGIKKQITKLQDVEKLKRIAAILNEGTEAASVQVKRIKGQPELKLPPLLSETSSSVLKDIPNAHRMRKPVTILRKRNNGGKFVKTNQTQDKSVH